MTDYISVDELKAYMGIGDAVDDSELANAVTSASRAIDEYVDRNGSTNGVFDKDTSATARVFRTTNPYSVLVDDFWDSASVIVKTDEGDNGTYDQTWTVTRDYILLPYNNLVSGHYSPYNRIDAAGGRWFPIIGQAAGLRPRVQVTAKWGWTAVPDNVRQACFIKAASTFRYSQAPEGVGGFDTGGISTPMWKITRRADPRVVELLSSYSMPAVCI